MFQVSRRPYFLEAFQPHSSLDQLTIPLKFVKYLEGKSCGLVLLTGPSGNTWHVELVQKNDGLSFEMGWKEFVRDHVIECGDTFVFRYDGDLRFTVQVFDQSACEKEAAFHAQCSQKLSDDYINVRKKRGRENEDALSDSIADATPKKMRTNFAENHKVQITEEDEVDMYYMEGGQHNNILLTETVQEAIPLKVLAVVSQTCDKRPEAMAKGRCKKQDKHASKIGGLKFSAYEEAKVSKSFITSHPHFVRMMKNFNVNGSFTLNIPYTFSMAHLPKSKTEVTLQNLQGECWIVNAVPHTKVHRSHTLCGGWMAFVQDNDIKVGNICIFELVGNCELRVHILEDGKEKSSTRSPSIKSLCGSKSHKSSDGLVKKLKGKTSKVDVERGCSLAAFSSGRKRLGKTGTIIHNGTSEGGQVVLYSESSKSAISAEEERVAKSFTSKFPYFVRIMKKFNISGSYTLKIPIQFSLAHLPDCKSEIILNNSKGECWTVNSIPDSNRRGMHTICGGWMAFVRGNNVKIGDICIFELVDKYEIRVHVSGCWKGRG